MDNARNDFPSIVELASDRGLIGSILRNYPEWVWQEADRVAEQDLDYQQKHNDPNRLPLPDPWRFLLGMRDVPESDKAVFRAAQSQLMAWRRLNRMRIGIATLNADWHQEASQAEKSADDARFIHATNKIGHSVWQFERVAETLKSDAKNEPALPERAAVWQERRRKQLVHSGERDDSQKSKTWPGLDEFVDQNKLAALLVQWWVRQGANGAPGFMFFRNEALRDFLKAHLSQSNLTPLSVKKVRQRLGLIPVGDKEHFVWNCHVTTNNDGSREIKCSWRNRKVSFHGVLSPISQFRRQ